MPGYGRAHCRRANCVQKSVKRLRGVNREPEWRSNGEEGLVSNKPCVRIFGGVFRNRSGADAARLRGTRGKQRTYGRIEGRVAAASGTAGRAGAGSVCLGARRLCKAHRCPLWRGLLRPGHPYFSRWQRSRNNPTPGCANKDNHDRRADHARTHIQIFRRGYCADRRRDVPACRLSRRSASAKRCHAGCCYHRNFALAH
ncbi:hypothetical protein GALL_511730 [mine drainage metagenome]|uniref:Uncharacterized protein n=1 Tax=mine drainage metagenome TaxID=410659 RepID=A0A1J5P7R0_9ZZZZ